MDSKSSEVNIALDHPVKFTSTVEKPTVSSRSAWRPWPLTFPRRYLWGLLVFTLLETMLIIGSYYFIQAFENQNQSHGSEVASISARRLEALISSQQAPIRALASHVKLTPNWPYLNASFDFIAKGLSESYDFVLIEACPAGQVDSMYIPGLNLTGKELYDFKIKNYDFQLGMMGRNTVTPATTTILQNGSVAMLGPWKGPGVLSGGAMVCRHSVFLHDDGNWDFSEPVDKNPNRSLPCPPEICRAPDNRTFWGFVTTIFPLPFITVPGLKDVKDANLRYSLVNDAWDWLPYQKSYPRVLASSDKMPDPKIQVCQSVNVFDWMTWSLCVSPNSSGNTSSWTPTWAPALYVVATLVALFISSLIFVVLRSLDKQVEWNREEKAQSELLQKTLGSLETERNGQRSLLREILPETVISVLLSHLHKNLAPAENPSIMNRSFGMESVRSSKSSSLSMQDVMNLSTAHDQVTVIFADIKGFTAMSAALHPSQVMLMLNDLFSCFDDILEEHDVYKVETIGDCFMAVTGLFYRSTGDRESQEKGMDSMTVNAHVNDAREAFVRRSYGYSMGISRRKDGGWGKLGGHDPHHAIKALRFAQSINRLASTVPNPLGSGHIEMRIGMHSGPVYSGVVGRKMPRFCLFGDTVNTASRMESNGEGGRIHVSESTVALLPREVWEERVIAVKGKGEMKTYFHSQSKKDE